LRRPSVRRHVLARCAWGEAGSKPPCRRRRHAHAQRGVERAQRRADERDLHAAADADEDDVTKSRTSIPSLRAGRVILPAARSSLGVPIASGAARGFHDVGVARLGQAALEDLCDAAPRGPRGERAEGGRGAALVRNTYTVPDAIVVASRLKVALLARALAVRLAASMPSQPPVRSEAAFAVHPAGRSSSRRSDPRPIPSSPARAAGADRWPASSAPPHAPSSAVVAIMANRASGREFTLRRGPRGCRHSSRESPLPDSNRRPLPYHRAFVAICELVR